MSGVGRTVPGAESGQVRAQLRAVDVVKNFGGVCALHRVSLDVAAGEILGIIGPNGAGKTTLLNCISGVYPPDGGEIWFGDQVITRLPAHRIAALGVARTFQNVALFKGMTVLDNLMLGRHVHGRAGVFSCLSYWGTADREEIRQREVVEDLIDFLEIEPIRKKVSGTLPLGLQKRVELGRALALDPKILLLDEPMGGMNPEEKEDMARFILDVNEERGVTVILIEHDMGVVMDLSHRVIVLHQGETIGEGSPAQVRQSPAVVAAYLGAGLRWTGGSVASVAGGSG